MTVFPCQKFHEGERVCRRSRVKLQDVHPSGAVSHENHWPLFHSRETRVQFGEGGREEVKVELPLPSVMFPPVGSCGQDSHSAR